LILAACSGGAATPSPTGATPTGAAPTGAASEQPRHTPEAACEGAAEEGTLIMWGGSDEEPVRATWDVFAESYPGIEFEYLSISPSDGAQQLITQDAAGQPVSVDLVTFEPNTLVALIERDMIDLDVDWEAVGVDPEVINDQNSVRFDRNGQAIVYNTDSVDEADLPSTWDELIDPQWADGKIVVDPRGRPFDKLALEWGEEQALDYVTRLKAINPAIIQGGTAGMVAVGTGEALITTGGLTVETKEQQAVGAPVDIHYLDVIPTEDAILSVVAGAEHPNAAVCLTAWMASEEGKAHLLETRYLEPDLTDIPSGSTIVSIATPEDAEFVSEMSGKVSEIWTSN
jgi:iron(III) transport system substrate-binding protein